MVVASALCESKLPQLESVVTSGEYALEVAENVDGLDSKELKQVEDAVNTVKPAYETLVEACDCTKQLFVNVTGLFVPGVSCILAAAYCLYTCLCLLVAANCCWKPEGVGSAPQFKERASKKAPGESDVKV